MGRERIARRRARALNQWKHGWPPKEQDHNWPPMSADERGLKEIFLSAFIGVHRRANIRCFGLLERPLSLSQASSRIPGERWRDCL
jgi:hypothetical protein